MPYEILKHTADVRLKVVAKDLPGLFREALFGMMALLKPQFKKENEIEKKIKIESLDRTALLVDFLNEVLTEAEINKEAYNQLKIINLSDQLMEAEIAGQKIEEFGEDIKAVTYHEAEIKKNKENNLEVTLVFDI